MKRYQWFNLVYIFVGIAVAVVILLQLLPDIIDLYEVQNNIKNSFMINNSEDTSNIIIEDKYEAVVKNIQTYTKLNGTAYINAGKTEIMAYKDKDNQYTTSDDGTNDNTIINNDRANNSTSENITNEPNRNNVNQYLDLNGLTKLSSKTFKDIVLTLPIDKNSYVLGTQFGDVITNVDGFKELSMGVDLLTIEGNKEVRASLDGVVTFVGDENDGYGLKVIVENTKNNIGIVYASLANVMVEMGDEINTNNIIGYTSRNTYLKTPHLHLEIYDTQTGNRYDPEKFSYK